jgi:hypothetical protein
MAKRKAMSKTLRFEVFKRDGFKCQYCGAHPPQVILQVDHIHPVAKGGSDEIGNLITSCQPCNLGKGVRSLTSAPQGMKEQTAEAQEREAQIKGFSEVMEAARQRMDREAWNVAAALEGAEEIDEFSRANLQSIRMFIKRAGYWPVLEAAEAAYGRFGISQRAFKYFCGICWGLIREIEAASATGGDL